jgi:hypothetical protein
MPSHCWKCCNKIATVATVCSLWAAGIQLHAVACVAHWPCSLRALSTCAAGMSVQPPQRTAGARSDITHSRSCKHSVGCCLFHISARTTRGNRVHPSCLPTYPLPPLPCAATPTLRPTIQPPSPLFPPGILTIKASQHPHIHMPVMPPSKTHFSSPCNPDHGTSHVLAHTPARHPPIAFPALQTPTYSHSQPCKDAHLGKQLLHTPSHYRNVPRTATRSP